MAQFLDDPNQVGLLSLGLRLMSTPGKFGAALGQSGLGAMGDMQQAKQAQAAAKQRAAQEQLLQLQMQQMLAQQAAAKRAEAQQSTDTTLLRSMMGDGSQGPELPNDPRMFLSRGGSMAGVQGLMGLNAAMAPKARDLMTVAPGASVLDPTNPTKPLFTAPDKASAPTPTQLAKLIQERDALPPGHPNRALYDQEIRRLTTHAPGVSVSYGVPMAGVADGQPVFFQPSKDGGPPSIIPGISPPPRAAEDKAAADKAKTGKQGEQMFAAIDEAKKLLKSRPTQSGAGAALDAAGRMVGFSPESAQVAAKLETLSGWMVANVPRMEGPQSNFDVENYKTMAAKVGDRKVPVPERLAALKTLEDLHVKYASINGTPRKQAGTFADPDKQRRYEEWKASQGK